MITHSASDTGGSELPRHTPLVRGGRYIFYRVPVGSVESSEKLDLLFLTTLTGPSEASRGDKCSSVECSFSALVTSQGQRRQNYPTDPH